jgi:hypothetical protein
MYACDRCVVERESFSEMKLHYFKEHGARLAFGAKSALFTATPKPKPQRPTRRSRSFFDPKPEDSPPTTTEADASDPTREMNDAESE